MKNQPVKIGSTRQLLLDGHVLDTQENVHRQPHRLKRDDGNPVIVSDRPWEFGAAGVFTSGGTVFFDEEDNVFKMCLPYCDYCSQGEGMGCPGRNLSWSRVEWHSDKAHMDVWRVV